MNKKTQKIAISAIMVALATLLSFITVYRLPYGGSITPFSMVPILLCGYLFSVKWGLLTGVVYGVLQALLGTFVSSAFVGLNITNVILVCLLDYIVAFGVLGLSGVFKKGIKNTAFSIGLGAFIATFLRFVSHFVSGYIVYGSYAEWFFTENTSYFGNQILETFSGKGLALIYSLIYNASYMIPEIILSIIGCVILINIPPIKKLATNK
ncbi:MAG: energy-coupled thiamine transporter ThiT [Clostridia bacterium]|nr:energy-coupled thiamine transporter ThiT [Clostridia bacterium]